MPFKEAWREAQMFEILPSLSGFRAAVGYFGDGDVVEPEGWIEAAGVGPLDERMFVCWCGGAVHGSEEPTRSAGCE